MIKEHFKKDNLHHAYLIEGEGEHILKEILEMFEETGIECNGNPDFYQIVLDSLKIEDALYLREMASQKAFIGEEKNFVISINSINREAQGVMLKMFEEPSKGTRFFMITPDASSLLPTLRSRFYFISTDSRNSFSTEAKEFIKMRKINRINYMKEFLADEDDDEEGADGSRAKAGKFLNALEMALHEDMKISNVNFFYHIFRIREYLRQPGSSVKNLMESLALSIPVL